MYSYCENNPVMLVDEEGSSPIVYHNGEWQYADTIYNVYGKASMRYSHIYPETLSGYGSLRSSKKLLNFLSLYDPFNPTQKDNDIGFGYDLSKDGNSLKNVKNATTARSILNRAKLKVTVYEASIILYSELFYVTEPKARNKCKEWGVDSAKLKQYEWDALISYIYQSGTYLKTFIGYIRDKKVTKQNIVALSPTRDGRKKRRYDEWMMFTKGVYACSKDRSFAELGI
jgi:hypothetical protein